MAHSRWWGSPVVKDKASTKLDGTNPVVILDSVPKLVLMSLEEGSVPEGTERCTDGCRLF